MRTPIALSRAASFVTAVLLAMGATALLAGCAQLLPDGAVKTGSVGGQGPATASVFAPAPAASAAAAAMGAASMPVGALKSSGPTLSPMPMLPAPGGPPPFASIIKDAHRVEGPLTLWQKDDKVWIELTPSQFGQPFLLSPKIKSGISEAFVLGGLMAYPVNGAGGVQVVEFQRVHNQVRLQARNTDVMALAGTPESRAVADAYSNSLLGSAAVASQPHPDRKSVLIEANALFLNDMLGIGMMLQRGLRQGYSLDRSNSVITAVRSTPQATVIETQSHFYTGNIATPMAGAPPGMPVPLVPRFLPDSRSLLVSLNYSLAPLPETPMPARRADPRIGSFTTTVLDFSNDLALSPRQRFVNRWRLEKQDPAGELSEPVKPITIWIDRNVPLAYRDTVRAGILEWNKAFEKIGFKNAIVVQQQADDAKFDTLDFGYSSVRWMMNAEPTFAAIGPSHVDPRSGEILDANIAFEGMAARTMRSDRAQVLPGPSSRALLPGFSFEPLASQAGAAPGGRSELPSELMRCTFGAVAAEQAGYALDVLEARGELPPDSPMAQQFVLDYIKESIMHEVGHVLGLRHNFRASRAYTEVQLSDPEFTRAHGTSGSVMEYNAVNLASPGKTGGVPFQTALGPYDYWAIEYAYKPMAAGTTPDAQRAELMQIAARSSEPLLAFGTDEDSYFGLDPETIQLDLGSDPVAFAAKRLDIARDLFRRQQTRELPPEHDYAVLRRSLGFALNDLTRALGVLARQIGGVRTLRDFPGSGRDPLEPVAAAVRRRSLDLMSRAVLGAEGFAITPQLQRRLAPDFLDLADGAGGPTDFALPQRLLALQRAVLGFLMSDGLAARIIDSAGKFDRPAEAFQLSELYRRLDADVWAELLRGSAIPPARRELQRDYINRLAAALLRPSPGARVDARGLTRMHARALLARLQAAERKLSKSRADSDSRMHIADSMDTLRQALGAGMLRQGL